MGVSSREGVKANRQPGGAGQAVSACLFAAALTSVSNLLLGLMSG